MASQIHACAICKQSTETYHPHNKIGFICKRCGQYEMTGIAHGLLVHHPEQEKFIRELSWLVSSENLNGTIPIIQPDVLKSIRNQKPPGVVQRANNLLKHIAKSSEHIGHAIALYSPNVLASTFSLGSNEVEYLVKYLEKLGYAHRTADLQTVIIDPPGYQYIEDLDQTRGTSEQGFVAMWFEASMDAAYSVGFEPGITKAGYRAHRVDRHEHIDKIDDEIIRQIRRSRFVVADFTGHRGGVYFEAGFALGLGLPVFWTCRKSDIDQLHFDIRQYNTIVWDTAEDLSSKLEKRIEAVLGRGPIGA